MDIDRVNLNDYNEDYQEWWQAKQKEMNAAADKLDAEARMRYDKEMQGLINEAQAENVQDWAKADWEQFSARVSKWWNSFELKADKSI